MGKPRRMQIFSDTGGAGQCFHVLSRVVDRRFVFGEREKVKFAKLLRKVEAFSGVEVVTWTILSNHFHIVVHIPERDDEAITDDVFWERLNALYSKEEVEGIRETMRLIPVMTPGMAGEVLLRGYRQKFIDRMNDVSQFMKTLKQRFTQWFNGLHERAGTLWESRFKSVLVEGDWDPLMRVAAYVDLNAVRAGIVSDPKDYRWCGYAEAVSGNVRARSGLGLLFHREATAVAVDAVAAAVDEGKRVDWRMVSREYRMILFGTGEEKLAIDDRTVLKRGITREEVEAVLEAKGRLSSPELLRCKLRCFTDGVVIGSQAFVEDFFATKREYFSPKRMSGARRLHGGQWSELRCVRDLREKPIG